jgi:cold shock CspA family protein
MRTHGTLTKWNDDRGFGFISPAQGGDEVFVHISAFPRDGQRPRLNELVSFDIEQGPDGKRRALRVMRPGRSRDTSRRMPPRGQPHRARRPLSVIAPLIAIAAIAFHLYSRNPRPIEPDSVDAPVVAASPEAPSRFQCDGRTMCSQMTSCAEAKYFIRHCPNTKMDGNGDGVPCEQQWCN